MLTLKWDRKVSAPWTRQDTEFDSRHSSAYPDQLVNVCERHISVNRLKRRFSLSHKEFYHLATDLTDKGVRKQSQEHWHLRETQTTWTSRALPSLLSPSAPSCNLSPSEQYPSRTRQQSASGTTLREWYQCCLRRGRNAAQDCFARILGDKQGIGQSGRQPLTFADRSMV